jgi:hypothetical protein
VKKNKDSVFRFFPARQVPEVILNESSKNTENALIECHRKETLRFFFLKTEVYVVSLALSLVFKTVFGNVLAPLVGLKSAKYDMSGNRF